MKKALISPNENVFCISAWTDQSPMQPIFTAIPNAGRVAEVTNSTTIRLLLVKNTIKKRIEDIIE
jgi:hypothetical protein